VPLAKKSQDADENIDWSLVSTEWELDCFSRPVLREGKKMWELNLCDENAVYRRVAQMKPTRVNSVVVQKLVQIFIEESKVKPKIVRFYRKVMKNMLTVALTNIKENSPGMRDLKIIPSRSCHMLRNWLAYREKQVYPKMEGFAPAPKRKSGVGASMVKMSYESLPKRLEFTQYAVTAIGLGALARVKPGLIPGKLCRIPPGFSDSDKVYGIVILSSRDEVLCNLLAGMELNAVRFDLETGEMVLDLGIDTTYKIEKVSADDADACIKFEKAKRQMAGLHFVAVHNPLSGSAVGLPIDVDDASEQDEEQGCVSGLWLCTDYSFQEDQ